jgi:hypothetical protein
MLPWSTLKRSVDFSRRRSVGTIIIRFPGLLLWRLQAKGRCTIYRHIFTRVILDERGPVRFSAQFFLQVVWFAGFAICSRAPSCGKCDYPRETRVHVFCEKFGCRERRGEEQDLSRVCLARFELGLALTPARATQLVFPRYPLRYYCVRVGWFLERLRLTTLQIAASLMIPRLYRTETPQSLPLT